MLYENYQKKLKRIATAISVVVKTLPIVFLSVAILSVIAVSLVVSKGSVGSVNCPDELVYGEELECNAFGMLSKVTYEYCKVGTYEWTTEVPKEQGEYQVRAVGTTSFGGKRYSEPKTITISPKEIKVFVAEDSIIYGEPPTPTADLLEGERVICESFTFADNTAAQTDVTPDKDSIKILDANGKDITACYTVVVETKTANILPRSVAITVEDYTAIYNGQECSFNKFEIVEGSLKEGDLLSESFPHKLIDVGSVENAPTFKVMNADGADVTHLYSFDVKNGTLTVDKRPLIITTAGFEETYTGAEQFLSEYVIDGDTTLADGHKIITVSYGKYTDCGEYTNAMSFKIVDAAENDVSANYSLSVVEGAIKINPKKITVTTPSDKWMYDGGAHHNTDDLVSVGLIEGHRVIVPINPPTITDAGTVENKFEVIIVKDLPNSDLGFDDNLDEIYINYRDIVSDDIYLDSVSVTVTSNYEIEYVYGTLEVTKRPITIKPVDVDTVYDGKVHAPDQIVLADSSENDLGAGAGSTILGEMSGERLVAGSDSSEVLLDTVQILLINNTVGTKDVTDNYDIKTEKGSITVDVRDLVIKTKSESWMYDGKPHQCLKLAENFVPDLADGDVLTVVSGPEVTNVFEGDIVNEFTGVTIKTTDGEDDRYANYNIIYDPGTIKITPRSITIETETNTKAVYNGKKQYFKEFKISGDGLAEGQALSVLESTSFEDAMETSAANEFTSFKIYFINDPEQNDVKESNYVWSIKEGQVQIGKRYVTVNAKGHEWTYDGEAHYWIEDENGDSTVTVDNLAENHYFAIDSFVRVTDYQENPAENRVAIKIYTDVDGESVDKTYNYEISSDSVYGKLIINKRPLTIITEGQTWTYDGLEHFRINSAETPNAVEVSNLIEDHAYMITGYTTVKDYRDANKDNPAYNVVTIKIVEPVDAIGIDKTHNYYISNDSVYGELIIEKRPIKIRTQEDLEAVYNGFVQNFTNFEILPGVDEVANKTYLDLANNQIFEVIKTTSFEDVMFDPESGEVIAADNEILQFTIYSADDENRINVSENYVIDWDKKQVKINRVDVDVITYNNQWIYDGLEHSCLNDKNDGVGMPLMYISALVGIDAYEIAECAKVTDYTETPVDNTVKLKIFKLDEDGNKIDKTANYRFVETFGTLRIDQRVITVESETNLTTIYDGQPHTFKNVTVGGHGIAEGQTFVVDKSTEIKYVTDGIVYNDILAYRIVEKVGDQEINRAYNYSITFKSGTIGLATRPVIIKTGSLTHTYDATEVSCIKWTYGKENKYDFVDTFTVTKSTTVKNVNRAKTDDPVGNYDNVFDEYRITDKEGVDRAANYDVSFEKDCGKITIDPRPIEVTSGSDWKEYDSLPLEVHDYDLTKGTLVADHKITNTYTGTLILAGDKSNEFTTVIAGEEGDVTYNYEITYVYGLLEVGPVPVQLAILENGTTYDGNAHYVVFNGSRQNGRTNVTVISATLDMLSITYPGSISVAEVDAHKESIMCEVLKDVENVGIISVPHGCYEVFLISFGEDAVTVTKRKLDFQAKDADKVYDGTPLWHYDYFISGEGLVAGHTVEEVEFSGSVVGNATEITEEPNRIESVIIRDSNGDDVTDICYEISYKDGTLTVYPTEESRDNASGSA